MNQKKKGFTLIEMLVVIAIVAILVSIVLPVVKTSTTRAGAAANAANLRAMEAKLNIMKLDYPKDFETLLDNPITETQTWNFLKALFDVMNGVGSADAMLTKEFTYFTADENGVIELWNPVTIDAVPVSAEVNVPGIKKPTSISVKKGDPMTIVITDKYVHAYYGNATTGYYSVDNFADVAEDGKFDGRVALGGSEGGGGLSGITCNWTGHQWGDDEICDRCGFDNGWHESHTDANGDHVCDSCHETASSCGDTNGDYLCDICGAPYNHSHTTNNWWETKCSLCGKYSWQH